VPIHTSLYSSY